MAMSGTLEPMFYCSGEVKTDGKVRKLAEIKERLEMMTKAPLFQGKRKVKIS